MGELKGPEMVILTLTSFSRYREALNWAIQKTVSLWGDPLLGSEYFSFTETDYYAPQMGEGLLIQLSAFKRLITPDNLVDIKLRTNDLEGEYAEQTEHPEVRPLNLDPGYLTPAKFVLATTKNASHRLYLGKGIYGEITLNYSHGKWRPHEWTYPNYRRGDYQEFLCRCRKELLRVKAAQD